MRLNSWYAKRNQRLDPPYLCLSHSSVSFLFLWMVRHRYELPGGWRKLLSQPEHGLHLLGLRKRQYKFRLQFESVKKAEI